MPRTTSDFKFAPARASSAVSTKLLSRSLANRLSKRDARPLTQMSGALSHKLNARGGELLVARRPPKRSRGHVDFTATRQRVRCATAWTGLVRAAIDRSRRQSLAFDRLFQDACDLLGESTVLRSCALLQGFLQLVGNISSDKNPFAVRHSS